MERTRKKKSFSSASFGYLWPSCLPHSQKSERQSVPPAFRDREALGWGGSRGRLGAYGCSRLRSWHQLCCLHAVLNPNVHGLRITRLLCRNSSLIRLGGVENTCYIRSNDLKNSTCNRGFAMEFWSRQVEDMYFEALESKPLTLTIPNLLVLVENPVALCM